MRALIIVLVSLNLFGCASTRTTSQARPMTNEQLSRLKATNLDCGIIDSRTAMVEEQLRMRGIANMNPEDMSPADRQFNTTARIYIWSLRIGCNNPDRYKS